MAAKMRSVVAIDFETKKIERRPVYPPIPVGMALHEPGREPRYLAWGHPSGNNTTRERAVQILRQVWNERRVDMVFHNAKFDVEVAVEHMDMDIPDWRRVHDTMFLIFLMNPHAKDLGLKPAAAEYLGMEPEEQIGMFQWMRDHGLIRSVTQKDAGAYISEVPGDIVAPYACGDVVRTRKLFQHLHPLVAENDMLDAYDRERRVSWVLLSNEAGGVRLDREGLKSDYENKFIPSMEKCEAWLRKRLRSKELSFESDQDVADALEFNNIVTDWTYTAPSKRHPNGVRSVAKGNLTVDKFTDKRVFTALGYRNRMQTCRSMFIETWLEMSEGTGSIFTNWNQVRNTESGMAGARTGRLSSSPNFQNIPKSFAEKDDGYEHPDHIAGVVELPLLRRYILPDEGEVFCHRDYNQQELRILAHFDDHTLQAAYNEDPRMDIHTFVQDQIFELINLKLERSSVKVANFGVIYGMGLGKLAAKMRVSVDDAKRVKAAQMKALPGVRELSREINALGKSGNFISTWGGRRYYCEEPKRIDGRWQTFEYKLLNYLIQGSAADCTKEALIRYDEKREHGRFLVTVHDEINISCPPEHVKSEMQILRKCMQSVEFDVPMLSDGKVGPSWGSLAKFEE